MNKWLRVSFTMLTRQLRTNGVSTAEDAYNAFVQRKRPQIWMHNACALSDLHEFSCVKKWRGVNLAERMCHFYFDVHIEYELCNWCSPIAIFYDV